MKRLAKLSVVRRRLAREESGFTLPELLVTMLMMVTVLFALYSLFDMSLRVFSVTNDKVEATETARVSLERMERELRMAHPMSLQAGKNDLLCVGNGIDYCDRATSASAIGFGNDLNNDRNVLECSSPTSCTSADTNERISYYVGDTNSNGYPDTLYRSVYPHTSPSPLVELGEFKNASGAVVPAQSGSLTLKYYRQDSVPPSGDGDQDPDPITPLAVPPITAASEIDRKTMVRMVSIQLNVRVDRGPGDGTLQKLTTDVMLRNRNR